MKTDTELTIACAEALGWESESGHMDYDGAKLPWKVWTRGAEKVGNDRMPSFQTCHNAAMQLVEFLAERGWRVTLFSNRNGWTCCFYNDSEGKEQSACSQRLPRAICLAFLQAVEAMK